MAQRRMFNKSVVNSARFIMMPVSSRELYFELGINADDDGIVEAFNILKLVSASEDDLKVLATKGFVKILNEELVTYITDWKSNNRIRADRKVDSIYKNLLLKVMPEAEIVNPKPRADTGKAAGRPVDNQWTAQVRLGKDRLGKDNKDNVPTFVETPPSDQPKKTRTKKEPKHYETVSAEYKLATRLLERIIGNNPDYEKEKLAQTAYRERKLQKWANVMRLMMEKDKHTPQQIESVIDWAQSNDFWWPNILSAEKLRKQYGTLQSQALAEQRAPRTGKRQVRESLPDWAQDGYQHKSKQVDPEEAAQIKEKLKKMKMMQQTEKESEETDGST